MWKLIRLIEFSFVLFLLSVRLLFILILPWDILGRFVASYQLWIKNISKVLKHGFCLFSFFLKANDMYSWYICILKNSIILFCVFKNITVKHMTFSCLDEIMWTTFITTTTTQLNLELQVLHLWFQCIHLTPIFRFIITLHIFLN